MTQMVPSSMGQRLATFASLCPTGFTVPERFDRILRLEQLPDVEPWEWIFEVHG